MIRILIADDHEMVREGLERILDAHGDLSVESQASDGDEVLHVLREKAIDVLVLDLQMPGPGFLALMEEIQGAYPNLPVLVVSMYPEEAWAVRAIKAGAAGYLTKAHSSDELAHAIRAIHSGGRYLTTSVAQRLASEVAGDRSSAGHESLSQREYQVLCLLGEGKMIKTIGQELGLSPRTVTTYRARVLEKLGLDSTADLIRYVVEHELTG